MSTIVRLLPDFWPRYACMKDFDTMMMMMVVVKMMTMRRRCEWCIGPEYNRVSGEMVLECAHCVGYGFRRFVWDGRGSRSCKAVSDCLSAASVLLIERDCPMRC